MRGVAEHQAIFLAFAWCILFLLVVNAWHHQHGEGSSAASRVWSSAVGTSKDIRHVLHSMYTRLFQLHPSNFDSSQTNMRRLLIGSVAPGCTYNECRGCKTRCRAEQVPIDGRDPKNSAYRYRCICMKS